MLQINERAVESKEVLLKNMKFVSKKEDKQKNLRENSNEESAEEQTDDALRGHSRGCQDEEIKFSKSELLQMLGSYEGELQARDEVIAILKKDYAHDVKGRLSLTDSGPIRALARDSNNIGTATQAGNHRQHANAKTYTVVQYYKKSFEKLKKLHFALERKYGRLLDDVGIERKINEEFRKKLNRFVKALEKDREELQKLLRDKAIVDTSEDEKSGEARRYKAKFYRKRVKKLNSLDQSLQKNIEDCKAQQETYTTEKEQLSNEVKVLRSTIVGMKKAEKDYKQIEEECKKLRAALEEELMQTRTLRTQLQALQNNKSKKNEIEQIINEAFGRFDKLQQSYDDERRKQHAMELQVESFKQHAERINELEMLSRSSECKFMQMQTTLRDTKHERNNLKAKLGEAEKKVAEYESQLQTKSNTSDTALSNLTKQLTSGEETCAEDAKLFRLKLNAAENESESPEAEDKVKKTSRTTAQDEAPSKKNLFMSSQELRQLLSMGSNEVIAVTPSRGIQHKSRCLTLELTNESALEEIKKLEAKYQQNKRINTASKGISPTSPTDSSKSKVTSLSNVHSTSRRFGLKKSGSSSDVTLNRGSTKQHESGKISTRPVTLQAKKTVAGTTRRFGEKSTKPPASQMLTKQPSPSNDSGNIKKLTRTNLLAFNSSSRSINHSSRCTRSKLSISPDASETTIAGKSIQNHRKNLETSKRRFSENVWPGSYCSNSHASATTQPHSSPEPPISKLAATSAFSRSNSVGASAKPTTSLSKLRASGQIQNPSRLAKPKPSPAATSKSKLNKASAASR